MTVAEHVIPAVCFIDDLARLLGTSERTIKRRIRDGSLPLPEMPRIDKRHRWSGDVVRRYLAGEHVITPRLRRVG